MSDSQFRALVVRGDRESGYSRAIEKFSLADLPRGDVLIRVHFSSLNYKDALSATGNPGVTRRYPHTPGIDVAGIVKQSRDSRFAIGDEVLCMGYDLGMNTHGGLGEYVMVPADWVLAKPEPLTLKQCMQIGTAGFTAAQCVERLQHFGVRSGCPVLVTGATGGVGSTAVTLLNGLGYIVTGVTGKKSGHPFLKELGCSTILSRKQATLRRSAAMLRERWAGVVDSVGGDILASAIKATRYDGVVTCCGNAASGELCLTVYPFILRGVSLVGIDSAACPMDRRRVIWEKLSGPWKPAFPASYSRTIVLDQVSEAIDEILAGRISGRIVVDCRGN